MFEQYMLYMSAVMSLGTRELYRTWDGNPKNVKIPLPDASKNERPKQQSGKCEKSGVGRPNEVSGEQESDSCKNPDAKTEKSGGVGASDKGSPNDEKADNNSSGRCEDILDHREEDSDRENMNDSIVLRAFSPDGEIKSTFSRFLKHWDSMSSDSNVEFVTLEYALARMKVDWKIDGYILCKTSEEIGLWVKQYVDPKTMVEWRERHSKSFRRAQHLRIHRDICDKFGWSWNRPVEMTRKKAFAEAKRFKWISHFEKHSPATLRFLKEQGLLEEATAHMSKTTRWDWQKSVEAAPNL